MTQTKLQYVFRRVYVTVMAGPANGACPFPDFQILDILVLISADAAYLARRVETTYEHKVPSVPIRLIGQLPRELAPRRRLDAPREIVVFHHPVYIEVFKTYRLEPLYHIRG